jgi:D-3-phosphoglycerate dehydrogenase
VVGTVLGDAGVNVADMAVGQSEAGSTAVMVLSTDRSVDAAVLDDLAAREGIVSVHGIDLV